MNCQTNCVKAKCLIAPVYCDAAGQSLRIGLIESLNPGDAVNVWIQDAANGWIKVLSSVVDSLGYVSITFEGLVGTINPNGYYNVWVTADNAPMSESVLITLPNDSSVYCVALSFERALGSGGYYCPAEQIVEV